MLNAAGAIGYPFRGLKQLLIGSLLIPLPLLAIPILILMAIPVAIPLVNANNEVGLAGLLMAVMTGILLVIAIPATLVAGYGLECTRQVALGNEELPEWGNWGHLLRLGTEAGLVYLGLALIPMALMIAGLVGLGGAGLSLGGLSNALAGGDPGRIHQALLQLAGVMLSGVGLTYIITLVVFAIVLHWLAPIAMLRFVMHQSVLAGLNPGGLIADSLRGLPNYFFYFLVVVVGGWFLTTGIGLVSVLIPPVCLLSVPANIYIQLVSAHLLGQYWRRHLASDTLQS